MATMRCIEGRRKRPSLPQSRKSRRDGRNDTGASGEDGRSRRWRSTTDPTGNLRSQLLQPFRGRRGRTGHPIFANVLLGSMPAPGTHRVLPDENPARQLSRPFPPFGQRSLSTRWQRSSADSGVTALGRRLRLDMTFTTAQTDRRPPKSSLFCSARPGKGLQDQFRRRDGAPEKIKMRTSRSGSSTSKTL